MDNIFLKHGHDVQIFVTSKNEEESSGEYNIYEFKNSHKAKLLVPTGSVAMDYAHKEQCELMINSPALKLHDLVFFESINRMFEVKDTYPVHMGVCAKLYAYKLFSPNNDIVPMFDANNSPYKQYNLFTKKSQFANFNLDIKEENTNIKLNGFNNGRDTMAGVGGRLGPFEPAKEKKEQIIFMWYDSERDRGGPCCGPHYSVDVKKIGAKFYHTLDELLKTEVTFSEATKKRLSKAKPGTSIKAHYLHRSGNLMIKRLEEDDIQNIIELEKIATELEEANAKAGKLDHEFKKMRATLLKGMNFNTYGYE